MTLEADGVVVSQISKYNVKTGTYNFAGNAGYEDRVTWFVAAFPHEDDVLNIRIYTNLDEGADNESWGISNFYLTIDQLPEQ